MSLKRGALAVILLSNLAVPKAHALGFTPQGVCAKAGFGKESSFHETCVSRVFKERRAAFWRETGPQILLGGLVAGASAATGGTAFGFMSRKADPQVASFDVGGLIYLVRVVGVEATVRPGPNIKDIKQIDPQAWKRVVEAATGCSAMNRVSDFGSFYFWLECSPSTPSIATNPAPGTVALQTVAASPQTVGTRAGTTAGYSLADELEKLAALRARGALTAAEFNAAKARLLQK